MAGQAAENRLHVTASELSRERPSPVTHVHQMSREPHGVPLGHVSSLDRLLYSEGVAL